MMNPFNTAESKKMRSRKSLCLILCLSASFVIHPYSGGFAMAQDSEEASTEKTPLEIELEIAKQKQQLAEAKKAEAEALKALAAAKLPSTETKGMDGTVTVNDGAGYYAEVLAYNALDDIAETIADDIIQDVKDKPVVILGQVELKEAAALANLLDLKITNLNTTLDERLAKFPNGGNDYPLNNQESLVAALSAAPAILGAVADIAAFFKTNRTLSAKAVTLNEMALLFGGRKKNQNT